MTIAEFLTAVRELPKGTFRVIGPKYLSLTAVPRIIRDQRGYCPIERVALEKGFKVGPHHYVAAGEKLGLSPEDVGIIVDAADRIRHDNQEMRANLEIACGLREPEPTPEPQRELVSA